MFQWMMLIICCHITTHTEPPPVAWSPGVRNRNRWRSGGAGKPVQWAHSHQLELHYSVTSTWWPSLCGVWPNYMHTHITSFVYWWWCVLDSAFLHNLGWFQGQLDFQSMWFWWHDSHSVRKFGLRTQTPDGLINHLNLNFPNSWQIGFVWSPFSNSIRPGSINIQSPCLLVVEVTTWHLSLCTDDHPPPGPGPPSLVTSLLIFSTNLSSLQWSLLPITLPAKKLTF